MEESFLKTLKILNSDINRKVLIIGNPALVLNCGWLLLNGPIFFDKNENSSNTFVEKRKKKCFRCCENCKRKKISIISIETEVKKGNYTENSKNKKKIIGVEAENMKSCECSCVCFGDYKTIGFQNWKKSNVILPFFKEEEVWLVFDEKIVENELKGNALKLYKEVLL